MLTWLAERAIAKARSPPETSMENGAARDTQPGVDESATIDATVLTTLIGSPVTLFARSNATVTVTFAADTPALLGRLSATPNSVML